MQPSHDRRLLDFVGEIQGLLDLHELWEGLLPALGRLLPSDWVSLHELDLATGVLHGYAVPEPRPDWYEAFRRVAHHHPLVTHFGQIRDGRAHRLSDFLSRAELHASPVYREVYGAMGIESQICAVLRSDGSRVIAVALARGLPDYDEDERALLDRARPFAIQAYRNALAHAELAGAATRDHERLLPLLQAEGLTRREAEILLRVPLGESHADVAARFGISPRTVAKHHERAYRKLGVRSRSEATARLAHLGRRAEDAPTIPVKGWSPLSESR